MKTPTVAASQVSEKGESAIAESPRFQVTGLELETAAAHEAELIRLATQADGMRPHVFKEKIDTARDAYRANPTDKNLHAVTELMTRRDNVYSKPDLYADVRAAYLRFIETTVIPWATAIITRGLTLERARLAAVTAEENQKHFVLTGHSMCLSIVVERARTPVARLEDMLSSLQQEDISTLRHRLFRALETFR